VYCLTFVHLAVAAASFRRRESHACAHVRVCDCRVQHSMRGLTLTCQNVKSSSTSVSGVISHRNLTNNSVLSSHRETFSSAMYVCVCVVISWLSQFDIQFEIQKIGHFGDILPIQSLVSDETKRNTRMWANAQRDGHPAKYRWRPLLNAAKFGWRPLLDCREVTLPRRESRWN